MAPTAYTADELHRFLVADAVQGHATSLPWAVAAYLRIGERTRKGADAAFVAVLDEVEALTGLRRMPVASATTAAELAALKKPT
jgi:hypothetical protein